MQGSVLLKLATAVTLSLYLSAAFAAPLFFGGSMGAGAPAVIKFPSPEK